MTTLRFMLSATACFFMLLSPGYATSFKDCSTCPEVVAVPPGLFLMGASQDDDAALGQEFPAASIEIPAPFALGKTEVTVGQFSAFVDATGYDEKGCTVRSGDGYSLDLTLSWRAPGFPVTDNMPVVGIPQFMISGPNFRRFTPISETLGV